MIFNFSRRCLQQSACVLGLVIGSLVGTAASSAIAQAAPTISINDVSVSEGNSGTVNATFTTALSEIASETVTVAYATEDNTAVAGSDYTSASGTLSFSPGVTVQTITVPIIADTTFENDETFFVNLSNVTNATIADGQGVGYIINDDTVPKGLVTSLADNGNAGTLRAEIARATTGDTITFQSGLSGTITLTSGELLVQKNITIQGPGASVISINGNNVSRVFHFAPSPPGASMSSTLSGVTITGGKSSLGGAIFNEAYNTLTLSNDIVTGNTVSSGSAFGGGIYNVGTLMVGDSTISNNTAVAASSGACGGGIYTINKVMLNNTTVSGNSATSEGGGFYQRADDSIQSTITNSTFLGNKTLSTNSGTGGGLYLSTGKLTLGNSTIAGNTATSVGGGIYQSEGTLTLGNCTIAGNTATSQGGGLQVSSASMNNTIVAGNNASTTPDIYGTIGSGDYNLIQDLANASVAGTHIITGVAPRLSALANNGGPTQTMALTAGSLAIGSGDPAFNATTTPYDQRGNGFTRVQEGTLDIGAVESPYADPASKGVVTSLADDGNAGTLRAEIARATTGDTITFQSGLSGTITLTSGELLARKNITIQGPGIGVITVNGNNSSRVLHFAPSPPGASMSSTLSGVTITGGKSSTGGGICSEAYSTLVVDSATITGNTVSSGSGYGGGIYSAGPLIVGNCTISNNVAALSSDAASGGGLYSTNKVTINNTTVSGNSATSSGGGIRQNSSNTIQSTITNSTFSGNKALTGTYSGTGGGLYLSGGALTLGNCTMSGNSATSVAGGICHTGGALTLGNCTVASNTAYRAGGIYISYATAGMSNTIVAGNTSTLDPDILGTIASGDYNFVQNLSGTSLAGTHNITGVTPRLSVLADNGGATLTMALTAGSLAFDAGDPAFNATTTPYDQRGNGFARVQNGALDIGAVEGTIALPSLSIDDVSVTEGNSGTTNATFTVTLVPSSAQTVTVNYATTADSATAGSDFTSKSGTLTFAPGVTTQTITVPVLGDTTIESNDTFTVNLSSPINATIADSEGVCTIINDDLPTLAINDVSLSEGNSGTTNATFTVTMNSAFFQPVTVNYATAAGTATANTDYTTSNGTVTFGIGTTTQLVTIAVIGDTTIENDETFTIKLSSASNATIADAQGLCTILNDDFPGISVNDISVTEGNSSTTNATFIVTLSAASPQTISVLFATADNTATTPDDYTSQTGKLIFAPNTTVKTFSVPIKNDTVVENDETFFFNLSNPTNATIAKSQGICTILNDDQTPTSTPIPTATATATPVPTATSTPVPTATATAVPTATPTSTPVPTATATATPIPLPTATPIPTATPTAVPTATPTATSEPTATPTAVPTVTPTVVPTATPTSTPLPTATPRPTATPLPPPIITVDAPSVREGNSGTALLKFTVKLSRASTAIVKVNVATTTASVLPATANTDYIAVPRTTLTFAPSQISQAVNVQVKGDILDEDNERIKLALSTPIGATLGSAGNEGTIIDDDGVPSLSINDAALIEGNTGLRKMTFTVKLSNASSKTITLKWATQNVTATGGGAALVGVDYISVPATTLTFTPGQTSQTVSISVQGDVVDEIDETFNVKLASAVNANIADAMGVGIIIDDETTPGINVTGDIITEGNGGSSKPTPMTFRVTLSGPSSRVVSVGFRAVPGKVIPATANIDYKGTAVTTLSFAPGEISKTVTVAVIGDTLDEDVEHIALELSRPVNAVIKQNLVEGLISDDDAMPLLSINDVNQNEGNQGISLVTFVLTLTAPSGKEIRATYATSERNATVGQDYLEELGTVVFAPGETRKTLSVSIVGDTVGESNELFVVLLNQPSNAIGGKLIGNGLILNDDVIVMPRSMQDEPFTDWDELSTIVTKPSGGNS
ncbi:anti-sigma-I factor RsgI2 (plasmid) [Abditibacteriota bacterium]|nr:anti-sigma-I factor RsgI2 [Abditibacteriota bacterium]